MKCQARTITIVLILTLSTMTLAADWPQFRGPERTGKSTETGLLQQWPKDGPKMLWSAEGLGVGWSSLAVVEGTIYTTGMVNKQGILFALDVKGNPKWQRTYGPEWTGSFPGVRSTPTVDGERIYVLSGNCEVYCFDRKDGAIVWQVDAYQKFKVQKKPSWGFSDSPLLVDDKLICTPGGSEATMAALNKQNGQVIWACKEVTEPSSYCPSTLCEWGGKKIVVSQTAESVIGVETENGKLLWRVPFTDYQSPPIKAINPVAPCYHNGCVFVTSGYNDKAVMLQLAADGSQVTKKWVDGTLDCHHGHVVLVDGYIYGANWLSNSDGNWVCLDWQTGKVRWEKHWFNKGSIIYADGMLYCYEEKSGNLGLVKSSPEGFNLVSSFQITQGDGRHWAHPVISDGVLYVRHGDVLMAFDIKG
jgi:outer membrane protein assembly factor BamB